MEQSRYKWKKRPNGYKADYYNDEDYNKGGIFVIEDTLTGHEYRYPFLKNKFGSYEYYDRILPYALENEEFVKWACTTSPDFGHYLEEKWMTREIIEILLLNTKDGRIFNHIPKSKLSKELCEKVVDNNIVMYEHIPEKYKTLEMAFKYVTCPQAKWDYVPDSMQNAETFELLYNSKDNEGKVSLIKKSYYKTQKYITRKIALEVLDLDITTIEQVPTEFITMEHAKKAVEIDGMYLMYVPSKYKTKDISLQAFKNNPIDSITYIPSKFQTKEMHKEIIDINPRYINRIPEESLSDEIIYYGLSKNGLVLGSIPTKRRTSEICDYAVNKCGGNISHVPAKYRTYDMCLKSVIKNSKLIKKVPVAILNQEFIQTLQALNIMIPEECMGYVNECLAANKKLEQEQFALSLIEEKTPQETLIKMSQFANVRIDSIPGIFSFKALKVLNDMEIYSLSDFFIKASQQGFITSFKPKNLTCEIIGALKLLKCKYLNEDPLIDENDEIDIETICFEFGFTTGTANCLKRVGYNKEGSTKKFFEVMRHPEIRENELFKIRNLGKKSYEEILSKTQIVFDYHDKNKVEEIPQEETLETLTNELLKLRAEIKRLNDQTDEVLAKIHQKMLEQSKGGVLTLAKK